MKILFLDFDGVLLTQRTLAASEFLGWSNAEPDAVLCALLRRCCIAGMRIVVSSSWRDCEAECRAKLIAAGLDSYLHDDWRTGSLNCRSKEIAEWLARHPEVIDYRIADDDEFSWTPEQDAKWLRSHPGDGMPGRAMNELAAWAGVVRTKKDRVKL